MKIIDLQQIIYPMSSNIQNIKKDYIYFSYTFNLSLSLEKTTFNLWTLTWYEKGKIQNSESFSCEYLACLKFLKIIEKISSDEPNKMKLLDKDISWIFFEKNQIFYFLVSCSNHTAFADLSIQLNALDIENYRQTGKNYLSELRENIIQQIEPASFSSYHHRKVSQKLDYDLKLAVIEYLNFKKHLQEHEKPKKSIINPNLFLFFMSIIVYIIYKYF